MIRNIFIVSLILMVGCTPSEKEVSEAPKEEVPQMVTVSPIEEVADALPILSSGMVVSAEEIRLSFKTGGLIESIHVKEGSRVKKGQVLARLNMTEINAQVKQGAQALAKAERDLERIKQLYADSVATLEQLQDLTTAVEVAQAQLEIGKFNQRHSTIYAPENGRILKQLAEEGENIAPGNPVFFLASNQGRQMVRLGLSERDVIQLKINDPARVHFEAWPDSIFHAKVSEIPTGIDPQSGTYEVELLLETSEPKLKNGFVGRVEILPALQTKEMRFPIGAVQQAGQSHITIFYPDENGTRAVARQLKGYRLENQHIRVNAHALSGLETVIVKGVRYLRDGSSIQIYEAASDNQLSQIQPLNP